MSPDDVPAWQKWPTQAHQQTEWEVAVAYETGLRDGMTLAAAVINERVLSALTRPHGHGGPQLDVKHRDRMMELFREYLGIGVAPDWSCRDR